MFKIKVLNFLMWLVSVISGILLIIFFITQVDVSILVESPLLLLVGFLTASLFAAAGIIIYLIKKVVLHTAKIDHRLAVAEHRAQHPVAANADHVQLDLPELQEGQAPPRFRQRQVD